MQTQPMQVTPGPPGLCLLKKHAIPRASSEREGGHHHLRLVGQDIGLANPGKRLWTNAEDQRLPPSGSMPFTIHAPDTIAVCGHDACSSSFPPPQITLSETPVDEGSQ